MWRACPIPSAKTVAQNPGGSFNPLSSFAHPWLAPSPAGLVWLSQGAQELPVHIAAIATTPDSRMAEPGTTLLEGSDNCIEHSQRLVNELTARNNCLIRQNASRIYGGQCTGPQPNSPAISNPLATARVSGDTQPSCAREDH